jgi:hypothetical protein
VLCAVGLSALPLARGSDQVQSVGTRIALVGLLALVAALVLGWTPLLPASLVLLGGLYGAQLHIDNAALDGSASVFAAGLLVTAELGYWSLEEREHLQTEPGEALRHIAVVTALGIASLLVAEALLVLADAARASGLAFDLVGAAAAAAALFAIVVLARERPES